MNSLTGDIIALEALMRWQSARLGLVLPDQFIPIAESHGRIADLQMMMIELVCQDIKALLSDVSNSVQPFRISINLSASQLLDLQHLKKFLAKIDEHGIHPSCICLEITETMLVKDDFVIINFLTSLIEKGFLIYMDDFGTGYSSLSYLASIPLSAIKLDKSFIEPIFNKSQQRDLVTGVMKLANSLGLKVVSEGVESIEQKKLLAHLGCELIQGYIVAKPMSVSELKQWKEQAHDQKA